MMSDYALILHPRDPLFTIARADLSSALIELGLLGTELTPNWYTIGTNIFEHITFLGCSPVINCAATQQHGEINFCRIHLPPPLAHPIWRMRDNSPPPRCPQCRAPDLHWRRAIPDWELNPSARQHCCPNCGNVASLHDWKLRDAAGFGRVFIELWGIHPGEAVPGDNFIDTLAQLTGVSWQWFYL